MVQLVSSAAPAEVDPAELYDGPNLAEIPPGRVHFVPDEAPQDRRAHPSYVATLTAAMDVLSARLLGLLATFAGCLMWGFAVYDPSQIRTYAAIGFSVTVLLPLVALYYKRG